jgi:S1-C subfamily serine protease
VNVVDVGIIVFVLALAGVGYERGLIGSALPLAGFVAGAALGGRLGPELLADGSDSAYAPVVTVLAGLVAGAMLAVALEGVAIAIDARITRRPLGERIERAGGAALLAALALLIAWAFGAVALHAGGPQQRDLRQAVQRSAILRGLNDALPPSGPLLNVLRRIDPRQAVEGPDAEVGPPNPRIAADQDVERAGDSVVKVLGTACGLGVEGSGWVAGAELVVTNAHVVAGTDDTTVTPRAGSPELDAEAVHYEPRNDLALLRVPGLALAPLQLVPEPRPGTSAAVLGYPENGPFSASAARIGRTGEVISQDSYGRGPVRRPMTPFRGAVRSGNSGGPAVDGAGDVLTTVFAAKLGGGTPGGYGISNEIVRRALGGDLEPIGTGPCAA